MDLARWCQFDLELNRRGLAEEDPLFEIGISDVFKRIGMFSYSQGNWIDYQE